MTLQWNHHDAGYICASGGKGRYEISEAFGNTVKVTHVPAVLQARQYGGTYVRVRAVKA